MSKDTAHVITIWIEGGVVHGIYDIPEGVVIVTLDSDVEGVEERDGIVEIDGEPYYRKEYRRQTDDTARPPAWEIRYTNAPEAYDYEGIVLSSTDTAYGYGKYGGPFRKVALSTERDNLVEHQTGRYQSGGYPVLDECTFQDWVAHGTLEIREV